MAPLGMESKHITHDYEIEGIESSGPMEVDAPCIIHCASRNKNCFGVLFCESNFYSVNLFMYLQ